MKDKTQQKEVENGTFPITRFTGGYSWQYLYVVNTSTFHTWNSFAPGLRSVYRALQCSDVLIICGVDYIFVKTQRHHMNLEIGEGLTELYKHER
jgi:hypothetical protein